MNKSQNIRISPSDAYPRNLQSIWDSLSLDEKKSLESLLTGAPTDMNSMRTLLRLSSQHIRTAFGKKHRVAIIGPTNVGKSTLYNQLIIRKSDKAEVSPLPGTTRIAHSAESDLFIVIDTPGADAIGESGENEELAASTAAGESDFLVVVFDAIQGIKRTELELYRHFAELSKPMVIVINKIDMVKKHQASILENAAKNLGVHPDELIPISAKTGENLPKLLLAVAAKEPELVAALGQSMPEFRWQLAWRSIISAASISAVIALTPLPIIDFAPLIFTQSVMVLGIARVYNYKITPARAREVVATFGLGFLGRALFYELSKLGGLPGWLLSAAIASSTTVVMGYAASTWFEKGEKLSQKSLNILTRETTDYLLDKFKGKIKSKPGKRKLQKVVEEVLENSPLADKQSGLDRLTLEDQFYKEEQIR